MDSRGRMKIGFISEHYPPTEGGVATSTQRVARELVKLGLNVHVICFDNSRPVESEDYVIEDNDDGVNLHKIGPFFLKQPSLSVDSIPEKVKAAFRRRAFVQIIRILKREKVDLILSFYLLNAGYIAQFAANELELPYVAGVRGNDIGRNIFNVERFAVIQWVVKNCDRIVCVNSHLRKRLLLAFPEAKENTRVIPNSVADNLGEEIITENHENRQKVTHATGWDDEALRIVFIGTLREKKGVVTLLKSLSLLRIRIPARLLIVGPEIGTIETKLCGNLWSQLKDEGILFVTGKVPRSEVAAWASGCDIVVMPSLDDGMANGLLEGMALGLCPVASEVFTDVIANGENGMIVPIGDAESLAEAFYALAINRENIDALGKKAKAYAREWTPKDEANAYMELFKELLSTHQKEKEIDDSVK
ncbi:MAG TPA: glycosyltransferase family 4 protein [Desulfitobacteriaceae bacterium]|nr:glycosyltransferase family 4 protein [Desulfitobacteriaceae bacterium]